MQPNDSQSRSAEAVENGSPVIEFRDVYKRFGRQQVLAGVNLALHRSETTVVIGESGAGKSVILKHMVGLLRPDSGEVYFREQRVDVLSDRQLVPLRQHFGFLFQMGALFDSLTVEENIGFPLTEHTQKSKEQIKRIVDEKLRLVGLDGTQKKKPAELSGGQKKRVALARAIALEPEVVLYDEPTTGLDPIRADVINELIRKLQKQIGVTSVVVTHDLASARKVGDRIIMLYQGKFIFDGTPAQLDASRDEHVRQFVLGRATAS